MDSNFIYDESGLVVGEAGPVIKMPTHDPFTYRVEESRDTLSRNEFVLRYLEATTNEKLD